MRKTKEELNVIKKKYAVEELWSFSRYNTYKNSNYEYFLKYVCKPRVKEDRDTCIYGPLGNAIHNTFEDYYAGKIKYGDMITEFDDALFTLTLAELKFDRSNEEKDKSIGAKYIEDIRHFFKNHIPIKSKTITEQFITAKIGEHVFQGYTDMVTRDKDGNYVILDLKSSTIYKGAKIIQEATQLILYSEAIRQMGVPLDKIKCGWLFCKYCDVQISQANGKKIVRQIERCKIGESLQSNARMWIKKLGYEDQLESYLETLLMTNDISCLPEDVQSKYQFDDCYVYVPLTEELVENLKEEIIETIAEIKEKERIYKKTGDDKVFWDSDEDLKRQSYYFAVLCGYSPHLHKPYGAYLDQLKHEQENKDNLFGGVGGSNTVGDSDDDSLAWLDEL